MNATSQSNPIIIIILSSSLAFTAIVIVGLITYIHIRNKENLARITELENEKELLEKQLQAAQQKSSNEIDKKNEENGSQLEKIASLKNQLAGLKEQLRILDLKLKERDATKLKEKGGTKVDISIQTECIAAPKAQSVAQTRHSRSSRIPVLQKGLVLQKKPNESKSSEIIADLQKKIANLQKELKETKKERRLFFDELVEKGSEIEGLTVKIEELTGIIEELRGNLHESGRSVSASIEDLSKLLLEHYRSEIELTLEGRDFLSPDDEVTDESDFFATEECVSNVGGSIESIDCSKGNNLGRTSKEEALRPEVKLNSTGAKQEKYNPSTKFVQIGGTRSGLNPLRS